MIGAQLYLDRMDTSAEARARVRLAAGSGLRLLRLFVLWDHVEPSLGGEAWEAYDAVLDEAALHGIGVIPTLFTQCPPAWMGLTRDLQAVGPLDDPDFVAAGEAHARAVVTRWARHPALHAWILWNEASWLPPRTEAVRLAYARWLRGHLGEDPAVLRGHVHAVPARWEDVPADCLGIATGGNFAGSAWGVLWQRFCVDLLDGHLARLASLVRSIDPVHPVHVNPHNVLRSVARAGQSLAEEATTVDFIGCSAHPVWHAGRWGRPRWREAVRAMACFTRDAAPLAPRWWITELQGGVAILTGDEPWSPKGRELRAFVRDGIAEGAEAVVFWALNHRPTSAEAGEWALAGQDGGDSPRLAALRETAREVEALRRSLAGHRPAPPQVVVLHVPEAELLQVVEGNDAAPVGHPRAREAHHDAVAGAWLAATELGYEVGFARASGLATLDPSVTPVVLVPSALALADATLVALRDYASRGGHVVVEGWAGWKDPLGRLRAADDPLALAAWGAVLADVAVPRDGERALPSRGAAGPVIEGRGLRLDFREPAAGSGTEVLARWEDEPAPAAVRRRHGAGSVTRVGTLLWGGFTVDAAPGAAARLGAFLPPALEPRAAVMGGPAGLRARTWLDPRGEPCWVVHGPPVAAEGEAVLRAGPRRIVFHPGEGLVLVRHR